jgi:hypothetical protein
MAGRTVLRTPYQGVLGLLDWAVDNWPYVNGRALFSGIELKELEASTMLDVVHYLFEDDLRMGGFEDPEAISKMRTQIYRVMYNREYRTGIATSGSKYNVNTANGADLTPFDPGSPTTTKKPYIPATSFDPNSPLPFGQNLDAPLK